MARQDWMRGDDERRDWRGRRDWDEPGYRRDPDRGPSDDFGLADYSTDYGYDPDRRAGYRTDEIRRERDDYGQADYATDYGYDPDRGRGYRRFGPDDRDYYGRDDGRGPRGRDEPDDDRPSWRERASAFFGGGPREGEPRRRRGPSDRVLWTVIAQRLEDARGLDLRDVEVMVDNAEVTLSGTVRTRDDKRRIEDIADIDGVRDVHNHLRVRERRWFS